jgi:excisionase family DNA binding protein
VSVAIQRSLRTSEVAAVLQVSPGTVCRWAKEGRLSFTETLGGHRRFPEAEVRALRAQRVQQATVSPFGALGLGTVHGPTLVGRGQPHDEHGTPIVGGRGPGPGRVVPGTAKCSCGWVSTPQRSTEARKRAHAAHRRDILTASAATGGRPS